jgi:hypothetical protein
VERWCGLLNDGDLPNSNFFVLKRKKTLKNEMDIIIGNTVAL